MRISVRKAVLEDAPEIARIYNQGVEDRMATFETRLRTLDDIARWFDHGFPLLVAEGDKGRTIGWAAAPAYRPDREAYRGVAEFSVYVDRASRGQGVGRLLIQELMAESERRGLWKLVSRILPENESQPGAVSRHRFPRGRGVPPACPSGRRVERLCHRGAPPGGRPGRTPALSGAPRISRRGPCRSRVRRRA